MEKNKFYVQGSDAAKESFNRADIVNFAWNIAYLCNFRCSYCFFNAMWDEYGKRNVFLSPAQWLQRWKAIHQRYGRCSLLITGGEPFIYPGFIELIANLSALHYPINISSNGSGDLAAFVAAVDPQKVSVTLSFHPEFNTIEKIIAAKKFLKTHGFNSEFINFVCYPPFFEKMDGWVKTADAAGEALKVIPFNGAFNGQRYPDAYTPEQKKILGLDAVWEHNVKRKGTLCKAGMRSALIFPDGKVARCGQIGERVPLGNFLNDDFRLLEAPAPCDVEYCPCLEAD